MTKNQIKEILNQLADHEKRIVQLEGTSTIPNVAGKSGTKSKTLREIIKGRKFKNGQEQVAIIVGYHEKILVAPITKENIKSEWESAKMTNKYSPEFLSRAKDVLIRINKDEICDLTQTGEDYFEDFIKNESSKPTSE